MSHYRIHIWRHLYLFYHEPHLDIRSPIMMSIYHVYGTYVIAGITMTYAIAAALRIRPRRRRLSISKKEKIGAKHHLPERSAG
jgi:hypothetical protein